jgi:hypothetical protein
MRQPNTGRPWAPSDDAALIDELGHGRSVETIATTLQRSPAEVRARLDALATAASGRRADPPNDIFPKDIAAS